eukprot:962296-Pyramimonas_sp.AAC.1
MVVPASSPFSLVNDSRSVSPEPAAGPAAGACTRTGTRGSDPDNAFRSAAGELPGAQKHSKRALEGSLGQLSGLCSLCSSSF